MKLEDVNLGRWKMKEGRKVGDLVRSFRKNFVNLGWKDPKEDRYFIATEKIFLSEKVRYVFQINFVPRCSIFCAGNNKKKKKKEYRIRNGIVSFCH